MQTSAVLLQKQFSPLPGLQNPHTLEYQLITFASDSGECYGIQVTETSEACAVSDDIGPFTASPVRARQIMTYLYENAVPAVHCVSVISDVCAAFEETIGEDTRGTKNDSAADCG